MIFPLRGLGHHDTSILKLYDILLTSACICMKFYIVVRMWPIIIIIVFPRNLWTKRSNIKQQMP